MDWERAFVADLNRIKHGLLYALFHGGNLPPGFMDPKEDAPEIPADEQGTRPLPDAAATAADPHSAAQGPPDEDSGVLITNTEADHFRRAVASSWDVDMGRYS
jgi:hypothetical protein